jgi:exopolysaccharide biosynthesis polyprenyl glycosylphosphotransferase
MHREGKPSPQGDVREGEASSHLQSNWTRGYLRRAAVADFCAAAVAMGAALQLRFGDNFTWEYAALSLAMPFIWVAALRLGEGYDARFIGTGPDEFRKVINVGVIVTAILIILSYVVNIEISRGYLAIAMPGVVVLDLVARYAMRKRLHKQRTVGRSMANLVAVGHALAVADLVTGLSRDSSHGLRVIGACVVQPADFTEIAGVPVYGGLDDVTAAVRTFDADMVAVLACPELDGIRLRALAWDLEKTGTALCVSPALLDVTGPRTKIRPVAGFTLLQVDHPRLARSRALIKGLFDLCLTIMALVLLSPLMLALGVAIRFSDKGPALFAQTRVGKDGRVFKIYKFRTMVVDAEQRRSQLMASDSVDGILFKLRRDPRVTALGAHLRRWSLDELPTLFNVLLGDMSLVGPRPAYPDEAAKYAYHVRRRLLVKPGITGLWQVNGRSDLSWEESVRLDLRYVENWSFALDLQILWRTISALVRSSGAY